MKIIDRYWSDRWWRMVTIYQCKCGETFNDVTMSKADIKKHVCVNKVLEEVG